MDDLYPFTTPKQQAEPMPYPFVEYQGNRFIQAYLHSRGSFLDTFDTNLVSPQPPSADYRLVRRELALGEVETSRILDAVRDDEEILKRLRKKVELRKLKNKYSGAELCAIDGIDADTKIYCRLAQALGDHYHSTHNLQSLSTLLKVNDNILSKISFQKDFPSEEASITAIAFHQELDAIKHLYHSLHVRPLTELLSSADFDIDKSTLQKKVVPHLGLIAQDGVRSRAYVQGLFNAGFKPASAIILGEDICAPGQSSLEKTIPGAGYFNADKNLLASLQEENIPYRVVSARSFNDAAAIEALSAADANYYIFSGSGILKDEILSTGKKLIHIHPGKLPEYRGSTTFLYSLLAEGQCAATGFIMNKGIDAGDIIASREFPPPAPNVDISRIYDPYIRSQVLVEVVRQLAEKGTLIGERQKLGGETYYMIHPVLRTLAIGYQRGELDTFNLGLVG